MNPSTETLFKHPEAISSFGSSGKSGNQLKERIKALQSVYRYARECIPHKGQSTLELLLSRFNRYHIHLKYVDYIERNVVYLPPNHYPRWVELPIQPLISSIEQLIAKHPKPNTLYTFISALIWKIFTDSPITPSSLVRSSAKLNMSYMTWKKHAGILNLMYQYNTITFGQDFVKSITIPPQSILDFNPGSTPSKVLDKVRKSNLQHNQELEDQFIYHNTYYPQSNYVLYDPLFPMIYYSDDLKKVNVPLIEGICPIILLAIPGYEALYYWFQQSIKKDVYKTIHSIEKEIDRSFQFYLTKSNYTHPRKAFLTKGFPRQILDYAIDNIFIMEKGIPINKDKLSNLPILIDNQKTNPVLDQQIRETKRQDILNNAKHHKGFCKGTTVLKSASSRTYYRHFNITSFPNEFKDCVEYPDKRNLWYFDIVANDISILFNISDDTAGIKCLNRAISPYKHIVDTASSKGIIVTQDEIKAFINPFIYGATIPRIIKESNGVLNRKTVEQIKTLITKTYPDAIKWQQDIIESVKTKQMIPNNLNPFQDGDIPIPKRLARRTACSIIIQRMGAQFMRKVIYYLANDSSPVFEVSAYVHDSLLLIPKKDMEDVFYDSAIAEALRYGLNNTPGIKVLNVRIGKGISWTKAESYSKSNPIFRL